MLRRNGILVDDVLELGAMTATGVICAQPGKNGFLPRNFGVRRMTNSTTTQASRGKLIVPATSSTMGRPALLRAAPMIQRMDRLCWRVLFTCIGTW